MRWWESAAYSLALVVMSLSVSLLALAMGYAALTGQLK